MSAIEPAGPPEAARTVDSDCAGDGIPVGYRAVFASAGVVRLLSSALLARLPIGANSLAILLLVREYTGSFGTAGLAVGAFGLTGAIASPFQGAFLDRFGPPRVLIPLALGQAVALIGFILVVTSGAGVPQIVLLAAVAGALVPPVSSCVRVLWPRLVTSPEALESAYALDATTQEVIFTFGPLLVALIVAVESPTAALLVMIVIQLIGTAVFITAPGIGAWPEHHARRPPGGALASRPLRLILATAVLIGVGIGGLEVGLPALAVRIDSPAAAGVLLAAWSVGSMIGGLAYGNRTWASPVNRRYVALLLISTVLILPLLLAGSMATAIGLALLAGLPGAAILSCQYILVDRLAPAGSPAEAFAWNLAGLVTGIAVGAAIAGHLVEFGGAGHAFLLSAMAAGLATFMGSVSVAEVRK